MKGKMTGLEKFELELQVHAAGARYHLDWRLRFVGD